MREACRRSMHGESARSRDHPSPRRRMPARMPVHMSHIHAHPPRMHKSARISVRMSTCMSIRCRRLSSPMTGRPFSSSRSFQRLHSPHLRPGLDHRASPRSPSRLQASAAALSASRFGALCCPIINTGFFGCRPPVHSQGRLLHAVLLGKRFVRVRAHGSLWGLDAKHSFRKNYRAVLGPRLFSRPQTRQAFPARRLHAPFTDMTASKGPFSNYHSVFCPKPPSFSKQDWCDKNWVKKCSGRWACPSKQRKL